MSKATSKNDAGAKTVTLQVLEQLFAGHGEPPVNVRLWDGTAWPDAAPGCATLVLKHPGALRAMFLAGNELALAEAYLYDDIDLEGNLESFVDTALGMDWGSVGLLEKLRIARALRRLPSRDEHPWLQMHGKDLRRGPARLGGSTHSLERDRAAIQFHYDVSNDFYALWLDRRMVYSCGYFQQPADDLDTAQTAKLEHICRKLRLRPGQRLLDIGCGWGGLALYAAEHYGVDVTGITLSSSQVQLAGERIHVAGLADRCRVLEADYREIDDAAGYDALVSVGMFEHVGEALLPTYFQKAYDLLRPGGVFLNHGIANRINEAPVSGPTFADDYVFPDGELVPISSSLHAAEEAGFEVRDVESLREHYTLTLRHWVRRLEKRHDAALAFVEEPTYRVWRLYMSGAANGFVRNRQTVYQTLLIKPRQDGASGLPLTRADWYPAEHVEGGWKGDAQ